MLTNAREIMVETALGRFSFHIIRKVFRSPWCALAKKNWRRHFFCHSLHFPGAPMPRCHPKLRPKMHSNLFHQTEVLNTRRVMSFFFAPPNIPFGFRKVLYFHVTVVVKCLCVYLPFSTLIGVESSKIHFRYILTYPFPRTSRENPIENVPESSIHTIFELLSSM